MLTKVKLIGIGVAILTFLVMYIAVSHYRNELTSTRKELYEARDDIQVLHNDLYNIVMETKKFNEKVYKIEELKNESYQNDNEEYRTYVDTVLPNDTRLLLKQARESASSKAD